MKQDLVRVLVWYEGQHPADMAKMAADPKRQEWWAAMEEVFHVD